MASLRIARINNIVMVYFVTSLLTCFICLVQLKIEHRNWSLYKEETTL
jgi:hypothetical protein